MGSTWRLAFRNLFRNPRRTLLALGAIAVAQSSVLMLDGMLNGFSENSFDTLTGPMFGHVQVHAPDWREERAADLAIDNLQARLETLRAVDGVDAAYARVHAPALAAREVDGHAVLLLGVDMRAESGAHGLLEGIDAAALDEEVPVLVGAMLAREAGITVGDELAILGTASDGSMANDLLVVTGILDTPLDEIRRAGIVAPLEEVQRIFALPDQAHEITIRGGDPEHADELAARIAALDDMASMEVLDWRALAPEMSQMMQTTKAMGFIVLFIVFLAAAAGVANTMLMATYERRRELGVLLALGTSPFRLLRMVLLEAVLLGLSGVAAGTLLGGGLVLYWSHSGIDMTLGGASETQDMAMFGMAIDLNVYPFLTAADVLPGFVGIVVVSVLAALLPAIGTARLEPMEAMRS